MSTEYVESLSLPKNLLFSILEQFSPIQLSKICQSNQQLASVCQSEEFWNYKYYIRFGKAPMGLDPKISFYSQEKKKLQQKAAEDIVRLRERVYDLIMSTVQSEDEPIVNKLADHVAYRLFVELTTCIKIKTAPYCFEDFNWSIRTYLARSQPTSVIRRPSPPIPLSGPVLALPPRHPGALDISY